MASSSFTGSTSNEYITPRIVWSSTANVETNKSSLTVKFQVKKSSSSTEATYGTGSWTLTIGSNTYNFSKVLTIPTNNTYIDVFSKTVTIDHNDDGSKSVAIKVTGSIPGTTYTSTSLSKTVELDTIPRASALSVPSSVDVYSNITVSISPANSSYRHKVKFVVDGATKYTSDYIKAGTKSFSYLIPRAWVSGIESKKMTVYLYTYPASGSTSIGVVSKTTTIKVPYSTLSLPTSASTGASLTATIGLTNSGTSYRHRIKYVIDGSTKLTTALGDIAAGATSYSYTIPHTWLTTAETATMTVYLYTYNSSYSNDYIAVVSKTVKLTVPSNIVPSITSVTPTIIDGFNGKYIYGESKIQLAVTAKSNGGSDISSYIYKGANISGTSSSYTGTGSTHTSSVIQARGTQEYTVQVKDKRGRPSDVKTTSIIVYEYAAPKITSITAQRCLQDGTLDSDGTYAKVTIKTTHSNLDGANTAKVVLRNNKDNTTKQIISSTEATNTYTGVYGGGFDIDTAYTITAVVTDSRNQSHTLSATLQAVQRTLNIARYGNGLAIGKLSIVETKSETPKFECNWDATFLDDVRIKHTNSRCFEVIRTGMADDIDNDGVNETADIQGQFYISDNGGVTCRRRYSTDNGSSYTAQGYWQLRNEDMYISDTLTVTGAITTNTRFGFNGAYNDHNFNIYGQWADGSNHDILVRNTDGVTMGLGWTGSGSDGKSYETTLDIRPKKVNIRGATHFQCTNDASTSAQNDVPVRIGKADGTHIDIDSNEIIAKDSPTTLGNLNLGGSIIALYVDDIDTLRTSSDSTSTFVKSVPTYNRTYDGSPNMYITSNGVFGRSTSSSERYKTDIENVKDDTLNPYNILDIPIRQYKYNEANVPIGKNVDDIYIGMIAEEVAKAFPAAAEYNEDGQVEMWNIKVIVPAMLKIIQDQQKEINELKQKVDEIKNEN